MSVQMSKQMSMVNFCDVDYVNPVYEVSDEYLNTDKHHVYISNLITRLTSDVNRNKVLVSLIHDHVTLGLNVLCISSRVSHIKQLQADCQLLTDTVLLCNSLSSTSLSSLSSPSLTPQSKYNKKVSISKHLNLMDSQYHNTKNGNNNINSNNVMFTSYNTVKQQRDSFNISSIFDVVILCTPDDISSNIADIITDRQTVNSRKVKIISIHDSHPHLVDYHKYKEFQYTINSKFKQQMIEDKQYNIKRSKNLSIQSLIRTITGHNNNKKNNANNNCLHKKKFYTSSPSVLQTVAGSTPTPDDTIISNTGIVRSSSLPLHLIQ